MKNSSGFTMIELMVTIVIIAILAAAAIPNLITWRSNNQLNASAREVMSFINGARVEAVKNNAIVNITIEDRRITSEFTNRATGASPPPKEVVLKPEITLDSETFTEIDGVAFSFNSRGLPVPTPDGPDTITLKNPSGSTRSVVIDITGITRIE